ncbi:MAG: S1 family peptidase [Labilithrix sp.]|nr:S1 family peptidase [Labilithrix sp.]
MATMSRGRSVALAAMALTSLACALPDEDDDDGVDVSSDAIVGGSETLERPEVGAFRHGGTLCTGTLVAPNVVLTAAHCVPSMKDEDVSTAEPAWVFDVTARAASAGGAAADRVTHRFKVARIHALPVASDFDGTQRWRRKDIALLRLADDVPASVARPAGIASRRPRLGGDVAVYGYGCTDRAKDANGRRPGSGTKRKKEYRWSLGLWAGFGDTQNLCPGDSGGPLLDVERSAVFGVHSGYVNGDDAFGDVPANRAAILTTIAAWR